MEKMMKVGQCCICHRDIYCNCIQGEENAEKRIVLINAYNTTWGRIACKKHQKGFENDYVRARYNHLLETNWPNTHNGC